MHSSDFDPDFTRLRCTKKVVTDESWIMNFLRYAPVGVLATVFEDQPFLSTKLFVYDELRHAIYMHSADEGRVFTNVQLNPKVCFTAYEMGLLRPASQARSFGLAFASVVAFGKIQIVADEQEMLHALQGVMEKYAPHLRMGQDYPNIQPHELHELAVYRLDIQGWSAKEDRGSQDHPGAYRYEDVAGRNQ